MLLAKWLIPKPRIIILDQPTRGIDVGAKAEIHRIISHLATQGIAVILIGDDAEEVMAMSDRILVFRNGRVAAEAQRGAYRQGGDPHGGGARGRASRRRSQAMTQSAATATSGSSYSVRAVAGRILRVREVMLVLALLLICGLVAARAPRFLNATNLDQVILSATLVCIVAVGQALVIIARQIDLSVGAIVAMSAFVSAEWLAANPTGSLLFVFLIGCVVGLVMGAGNALLVAVFKIPAIVATLGTLAIYRGAATRLCRGQADLRDGAARQLRGRRASAYRRVPFLVWLALDRHGRLRPPRAI